LDIRRNSLSQINTRIRLISRIEIHQSLCASVQMTELTPNAQMTELTPNADPECANTKQKRLDAGASSLLREFGGVADGARTHDNRNHNPGLYQLSYSHH
jgi:hypothetical protein